MKHNERLQAQRWLYGREITADDIMWADRERGVLVIRDSTVADRIVAATMVEAGPEGVVLFNVADLPPITQDDVESMKEHIAQHLAPHVADGEIKKEHPRRYKPIVLSQEEAEYVHIAYMLLRGYVTTDCCNDRTATTIQRTLPALRAALERGNFRFDLQNATSTKPE